MANLNTYFANPTFDHILKNLGLCQNIEKLEIWDSTFITNTTLSMISKNAEFKTPYVEATWKLCNWSECTISSDEFREVRISLLKWKPIPYQRVSEYYF